MGAEGARGRAEALAFGSQLTGPISRERQSWRPSLAEGLFVSYSIKLPGVCGVRLEGQGLTSQWGGSPTTLVHTIPGRMGMLSLPRAACSRLQALGPKRVTGTV